MSENLCQGCPSPCCIEFTPRQEIANPEEMDRIMKLYPYIFPTGRTRRLDLLSDKPPITVRTFTCTRYIEATGSCQDHDTLPRPQFCIDAGPPDHPPHYVCLFVYQTNLKRLRNV